MVTIGAKPPERLELGRFADRLSFLYAERCVVHREDNAVTFSDADGIVHAPAAVLAAVILGPGTRVTHAAMNLLGTCGVTVVWVGEQGVRYYAHGRPLSASSRMAELQAKLISNNRTRLRVARDMYRMRFADENVDSVTLRELRGREGARMRRRYREESMRTGVAWTRRSYDPADYESGDPINRALTAGNAALYGVVHAGVVAMGCVPSLGFVHRGTDRAFVYDIADLYKSELVLPIAFDTAAAGIDDVDGEVRRRIRDAVRKNRLMQRIPRDIVTLLGAEVSETDPERSELQLWSEVGYVDARVNYSRESTC